jgi:hypothetical protein
MARLWLGVEYAGAAIAVGSAIGIGEAAGAALGIGVAGALTVTVVPHERQGNDLPMCWGLTV